MLLVCNASIPEPSQAPSTCGRAKRSSGREGLDRPPYTRTEVLFLDSAQPQHTFSYHSFDDVLFAILQVVHGDRADLYLRHGVRAV